MFKLISALLLLSFAQYVPTTHNNGAPPACGHGAITEKNKGAGADAGTANTATVAATINATNDLVAISAWCFDSGNSTCTFSSVTVGSQTATSWTKNANFTDGAGDGHPQLYFVPSTTVSGSQTITLTVSGTHTDVQVGYIDFAPGANCTFVYDTASTYSPATGVGSGNSATANAPSITATAGDVEYVFTSVANSVSSVGTPWTAGDNFPGPANEDAYILNASGSATANNMSVVSGAWQAGIMSFKQQ